MESDSDIVLQCIEADRRERLRLALAATQSADLLPLLDAASGAVLGGQYRLDGVHAVGGQFFVWSAVELTTRRRAILKQARFDYRYPVRYGRMDIEPLRAAVRREYDVLWADRTGTLPRPLALLVAGSPVPAAAASPALAKDEVFVVEEHVCGLTLTELALRVWPQSDPNYRESIVAHLASDFVTFWDGLRKADWFYGDLSADNLLVERSGKLRVVDAGSAVPGADKVVLTGFTPAFSAPGLYLAAAEGRPIGGTLASVLPCLAKILHFALTGREQLNGAPADLADPALQRYSSLSRRALETCTQLDVAPDTLGEARDSMSRWFQSFHERPKSPSTEPPASAG
jgi:hypothetical protein